MRGKNSESCPDFRLVVGTGWKYKLLQQVNYKKKKFLALYSPFITEIKYTANLPFLLRTMSQLVLHMTLTSFSELYIPFRIYYLRISHDQQSLLYCLSTFTHKHYSSGTDPARHPIYVQCMSSTMNGQNILTEVAKCHCM